MVQLASGARTRLKSSQEYREIKQETDRFRRRLRFLAFFTEMLKRNNVDAVLVGGEAIDVYTAGTFSTSDIDLVVSNKAIAEQLLNKFGFEKKASGLWLSQELIIVVQVIAEPYSGDASKIRTFRVKDYELKIAAPEDLIINRLYSAKFWKSNPQRDMEQAIALLRVSPGKIDNKYLNDLAKKNHVMDYLAKAGAFLL